jgi:hypothetical protein
LVHNVDWSLMDFAGFGNIGVETQFTDIFGS